MPLILLDSVLTSHPILMTVLLEVATFVAADHGTGFDTFLGSIDGDNQHHRSARKWMKKEDKLVLMISKWAFQGKKVGV